MFGVFLLIALLISVSCHSSSPESWNSWKSKHQRVYSSDIEEETRYANFKVNIERINYLNEANPSATYAPNRFSDLSHSEFISQHTGDNGGNSGSKPSVTKSWGFIYAYLDSPPPAPKGYVPDSYNWVELGAVSPTKDQGGCGSCWAFAATRAVESQLLLASGESTILSEQAVVDCVQTPNTKGCEGGNHFDVYQMYIKHGGVLSSDHPYLAVTGEDTCPTKSYQKDLKIQSWSYLNTDLQELKSYLYNYGPFVVSINSDDLSPYAGGIFNPPDCDPAGTNHAVTVVGYISDYDDGQDVWVVSNSWGTDWGIDGGAGEDGYFYIPAGLNTCGIESYPRMPFMWNVHFWFQFWCIVVAFVLALAIFECVWVTSLGRDLLWVKGRHTRRAMKKLEAGPLLTEEARTGAI